MNTTLKLTISVLNDKIQKQGGEYMKTKTTKFITGIKYEILFFALLCIRACMNLDFSSGMDKNFLLYYLVDFSMSKTSRVMIGSLVNLLTDNPTREWINCFAAVILILTFILTSVIISRIIKYADDEMRPCVFVLSLFFVSGSFTLHGFSSFFGMLDIYMYLFTVFALVALNNKYLKWLLPLFCIGGVMINYAFVISYFPIIVLALFYLIVTREKKTGNIILFLLSVSVTAALTVYCIFYGEYTTTVTLEEIWQTVESKSGIKFGYENLKYYDYYLLGHEQDVLDLNLSLDKSSFSSFVKMYADYMLSYGYKLSGILSISIGILPIYAVFIAIWVKCIKASESKPRKFVYACFILSVLFVILCFATSTDVTRWACVGVMLQFGLCYFMFVLKDEPFMSAMLQLKQLAKNKSMLIGIIYVIYTFGFEFSLTA